MKASKVPNAVRLVTIDQLAHDLSCSTFALHKVIKRQNLGPAQGVYNIFGGHKGLRVDEDVFLYWREIDQTAGHGQQLAALDTVKRTLVALLPLKTQLDGAIKRLLAVYESGEVGPPAPEVNEHGQHPQTDSDGTGTACGTR